MRLRRGTPMSATSTRSSATIAAFAVGVIAVMGLAVASGAQEEDPQSEDVVAHEVATAVDAGTVDAIYESEAGQFPVPEGTSLDDVKGYVKESGATQSVASFRSMLAFNASCLWVERSLGSGPLPEREMAAFEQIAASPAMQADADEGFRSAIASLVDAARVGDADVLRSWSDANCP
jgi:hypothetical protein